MGSFCGSSSTTTKQNIDPRVKQFASDTLDAADYATSRPYQTYGGPRVAGFTGDQQAGFNAVRNAAGAQAGNMDRAMTLANKGAGSYNLTFSPGNISAGQVGPTGVSAGMINPQRLGGTNLSPYMDPFTQDVVNSSVGEIMRGRNIMQQDLDRGRMAAGAFGGSRHGVQAGELDRSTSDVIGRTVAGLMSQNFGQAQAAAQGDINRDLQAQMQNVANQYGAQTFNAGQNMQAQLANVQNQLGADTFNAQQAMAAFQQNAQVFGEDRAREMMASDLVAKLAAQGQQMSMADAAQLLGIGQMQQGQTQQNLDTAYGDFLEQRNYPLDMLNTRVGIMSGTPYGTRTTQPGGNPLASILGSLATGAALGNNFGWWG